MNFFTRDDLQYCYDWKPIRDNGEFHRDHGHTVLSFINTFGSREGVQLKVIGHKIERLLHEHVPEELTDSAMIYHWMIINWRRY